MSWFTSPFSSVSKGSPSTTLSTVRMSSQSEHGAADNTRSKRTSPTSKSSTTATYTSAGMMMKASRCPTEELTLTNCAICNPNDFDLKQIRHIELRAGTQTPYIFTLRSHPNITPGTIGFSLPQRKWATLSLNQDIEVRPRMFDVRTKYMSSIVLEVDFLQKKTVTKEPYDSDKMAQEFLCQFPQQSFVVGQHLVFQFMDLKVLSLVVKEISVASITGQGEEEHVPAYVTNSNTGVTFEKAENSPINLTGKSKTCCACAKSKVSSENVEVAEQGSDPPTLASTAKAASVPRTMEARESCVVAVAVDGNKHSDFALKFYMDNLYQTHHKVNLIHVAQPLHDYELTESPDEEQYQRCVEATREKNKNTQQGYKETMDGYGIHYELIEHISNKPGEAIVNKTTEIDAKFLVVGSRGLDAQHKCLLGSVSEYVIHHSECPVFVCRTNSGSTTCIM